MSSLSSNGIPGPDPAVSSALSQFHGGHWARRIRLAGTVIELEDVLKACRRSLTPMHIACSAAKLQELNRWACMGPAAAAHAPCMHAPA